MYVSHFFSEADIFTTATTVTSGYNGSSSFRIRNKIMKTVVTR